MAVGRVTWKPSAIRASDETGQGDRGRQAGRRRAEGHDSEYPSPGGTTEAESMSEYLVVIEHERESWGAYCPDLPGVGVVGESQDEVEQLIREAISLHLDG